MDAGTGDERGRKDMPGRVATLSRGALVALIGAASLLGACSPNAATRAQRPDLFVTERALPVIASGDLAGVRAIASARYLRATSPTTEKRVSAMIASLGPLQDSGAAQCEEYNGFALPQGISRRAACRVDVRHALTRAVYAFALSDANGVWKIDGFNVNAPLLMQWPVPTSSATAEGFQPERAAFP